MFTFFWYTETKKTRKCRLFLKLLRGFIIAKTSIPELDFKSTVFCKNTICIILWIKFFVLLAEKKIILGQFCLYLNYYNKFSYCWMVNLRCSFKYVFFPLFDQRVGKRNCINYWKSCILNLKLLILTFFHQMKLHSKINAFSSYYTRLLL